MHILFVYIYESTIEDKKLDKAFLASSHSLTKHNHHKIILIFVATSIL